jgi:hypothetical protein
MGFFLDWWLKLEPTVTYKIQKPADIEMFKNLFMATLHAGNNQNSIWNPHCNFAQNYIFYPLD